MRNYEYFHYFVLLGFSFLRFVQGSDGELFLHIAKVGDRAVLPCYHRSTGGSNSPQVRWFQGMTMISYGITVYKDRSKFEIEKPAVDEWNLVIKNVEPSDEAIYTCKTVEDGIERETERSLKVETKPEIDERASSPESISVNEGDALTIWCNVSGTPEPTVSWQRTLGRDDPPVDIGATGNELTLPEVTRYATDVYICKVSNPHGTVTRRISITVKFPVRAAVYQEEVTADLGEEVAMACMVEGQPIIDAYWKDVHGRKIISNWQFEAIKEPQHGFPLQLLTIKIRRRTLTEREYGTYTCYVAGDGSEHEARVLLSPTVAPDTEANGDVIRYEV